MGSSIYFFTISKGTPFQGLSFCSCQQIKVIYAFFFKDLFILSKAFIGLLKNITPNREKIEINSHDENIELYKDLNLKDAIKEYLYKTPIFTKQFLAMSDKNKSKLFEDLQLKLKKYYHKKVLKFPSKTWIIRAQK